jgi:membrane-bound lytic murein transglycosylase D
MAFTLGRNGPQVTATVEEQTPAADVVNRELLAQYANYYLKQSPNENAGERTLFIRQAFRDLQRKQRRRNGFLPAAASTLIVAIGSYAFYQHSEANNQQQLALNLFYQMKSVELETAKSETTVLALKGQEGIEEIRRVREQKREMEVNYDKFLKQVALRQ